MKQILIIFIFLCGAVISYAQKNYAKELLSTKWYQDVSDAKKVSSKIMVFKKLDNKVSVKETTTFKADGIIKRCFSDVESLGGATALTCDSSFTYQIKKDLIHISDKNILHLYYKMKLIPNGIELKTIEPELFYKK